MLLLLEKSSSRAREISEASSSGTFSAMASLLLFIAVIWKFRWMWGYLWYNQTKSVFITGGSQCVPVVGFLQFKPHLLTIKLEIKSSYLHNKSLLNNLWRGHHVTDNRWVFGCSEQLHPTDTAERCWWYSLDKWAQHRQWRCAVELEDGKEAQHTW